MTIRALTMVLSLVALSGCLARNTGLEDTEISTGAQTVDSDSEEDGAAAGKEDGRPAARAAHPAGKKPCNDGGAPGERPSEGAAEPR